MFPQQDYVNILQPSRGDESLCAWKQKKFKMLLKDFTDLLNYHRPPFNKVEMRWSHWPKIIQVNEKDIHILGGTDTIRAKKNGNQVRLHFKTRLNKKD